MHTPPPALVRRETGPARDAERQLCIVSFYAWGSKAASPVRGSRPQIVNSASLQTARISGPRGVPHRRQDIVDNRLPCFVGDLSTGANPVLIDRCRQADLLLAVGARIGEITSQSYSLLGIPDPGKTLIHVHVGAEELGRVFRPSLAIQSGMPEFAAAVAAMEPLPPARWSAWRAALRREYEAWLTPAPSGAALDLGEVMSWLRRRLPDDAIVTSDAGNFSGWPNRYLQYRRPGRQLGPTSGAMGYASRPRSPPSSCIPTGSSSAVAATAVF